MFPPGNLATYTIKIFSVRAHTKAEVDTEIAAEVFQYTLWYHVVNPYTEVGFFWLLDVEELETAHHLALTVLYAPKWGCPPHSRACLFQSFFNIACSRPCLVPLLQGLLLCVPVKPTLGVLGVQSATHMRVSQCGVCWCSPYQGFPSTVRAHSRGMAFCGFRGGVHQYRQRTNTYSCTPTALVSFHCITRSLPDTLLWAPAVCRHFAALILSCILVG